MSAEKASTQKGVLSKTANFSIVCESCGTEYQDSEVLEVKNNNDMYDLLHAFNKNALYDKYDRVLSATGSGNFKYCRKWMKCPHCGYTPSWNVVPAARSVTTDVAFIFMILLILIFLAALIIQQAPFGSLVILLLVFTGALLVSMRFLESMLYLPVRIFFKPNRKFPKTQKTIAPKVTFS